MGQLVFQATLGGQVNLVGPNTASTFNINVPAVAGNMVTTGDTGTVTNTMLAGSIANAKLTNSSVTIGSTSVSLGATAATITGLTLTNPTINGFTGDTSVINVGSGQFYKDTSGNVGIGTSSPSAKLQVGPSSSAGASLASSVYLGDYSSTAQLRYVFNHSGSNIWGIGSDGVNSMIFGKGSTATGTVTSEFMRIDSSGNLLVGTTSARPNSTTVDAAIVAVNAGTRWAAHFAATASTAATDVVTFSNPNGKIGAIQTSGSTTAYLTSSDYRLKENVQSMTGALSVVQALKPCTYNWKVDGAAGQGFIAHELQAVVPDCVTGEKDAVDADGNPVYQGIDTSFLVATLTAAIQELKAIVDAQAVEIAALKGQA